MRDYKELAEMLRYCAQPNTPCEQCPYQHKYEAYCFRRIRLDAANAVEELLAVLGNIASAVFYYGDDPGLSEIIMRKLWKVGIVKMDGDLWVWNTPTKEVNNEIG